MAKLPGGHLFMSGLWLIAIAIPGLFIAGLIPGVVAILQAIFFGQLSTVQISLLIVGLVFIILDRPHGR